MALLLNIVVFMGCWTSAIAVDLKDYSKSIPQLILNSGIQQLGSIHIPSLIQELDQVRWSVSVKRILVGSGKPRFACNYFIKDKRVICDMNASSAAVLPLVTLHEGLGALGYIDEDYQMSTALAVHALTRISTPIQGITENLTNIKRRAEDEKYKSNSGTSVGGGGDSVGVTIKTFTIAAILNSVAGMQLTQTQQDRVLSAIRRIMAALIENNLNDEGVRIEVKDNLEKVYVSYIRWTQIQMNTSASDIVTKQVELYEPIMTHFLKPL